MAGKRPTKSAATSTLLRVQRHMSAAMGPPEPWDKDRHFEACIQYDVTLPLPDHPAFWALVDRIYVAAKLDSLIQLKSPRAIATARAKRRTELGSLLWHLYLAFANTFVSSDGDLLNIGMTPSYVEGSDRIDYREFTVYPYIRISLNKNNYLAGNTSNPYGITARIKEVLRALQMNAFIEVQRGYFSNKRGTGRQTRIRPDSKLDAELRTLPDLALILKSKPAPSSFRAAVVKSGRKKSRKAVWEEVPCPLWTPELQAHAKLVDRFNTFIDTQRVELVGARSGVLMVPNTGTDFVPILTSNRYIQNVYHIEDDGQITFGRMFGGFWQSMPSRYRHLIRINGEAVVVLDFKAMILNIVASHCGRQLTGDPYDIDIGFGVQRKDVQRSLIKSIVIIGINSKSRMEALFAVRSKEGESFRHAFGRPLLDVELKRCITDVEQAHPFLKTYLFKKLGKSIFAIDADIARGVLRRFLDAKKVVLPIHDGFVAAQSDREFLRSAMESSWKDEFPTVIGIAEE